MGACGRCMLVSTLVLVVGVGMLLNVRIPKGFQEPTKLRLFFGALHLFDYVKNIREKIYGFNDSIQFMRENMKKFEPAVDMSEVETRDTGFDGVAVRIYKPTTGLSSNAAVIYFHGGGWVFGSIDDQTHATMVEMTCRLKITVVSVEYRLSPENPYPTPFDDCVTATKYFLDHAGNYGVDPDRVAVMGDSAGGNLAAAVSLLFRDKDYDPMPKLQVLLNPPLQAIDFLTPSYQKHKDSPLLTKKIMVRFWLLYAFGDIDDEETMMVNMHTSSTMKKQMSHVKLNHKLLPPNLLPEHYEQPDLEAGNSTLWEQVADIFEDHYFAPLMADDLSALPQAYIFTAEQDVLRDDGIWYAQRLREIGNDVTHEHSESSFHGIGFLGMFQDYHDMWEKVYKYLEKEL